MGIYGATNANGEATFLLSAIGGNSTNYNGYKFRADYSGTQTWSDPLLVAADVDNPVSIEVGGSSSLSPIPRFSVSPIRRGEEIQLASLYLLPGLLAQAVNSALADSNGEYLYFYHNDHLGTPLFLTDIDGVVVWRGEYLPFGEVFSEDKDPDGDGVDVQQPFRFPGQYADEETGLYYNYFRDYDPQLGRYVEVDPSHRPHQIFDVVYFYMPFLIPNPQELHDFSYVINSPSNYIDSKGLFLPISGPGFTNLRNEGDRFCKIKTPLDICLYDAKKAFTTCSKLIWLAQAKATAVCAVACIGSTAGYSACFSSCAAAANRAFTIGRAGCIAAYIANAEYCRATYGK